MDQRYKLIPAELPHKVREATNLYEEIIRDFVGSDLESAIVELPERKPATMTIGLRAAIKTTKADVKVAQRGEQVFLVK